MQRGAKTVGRIEASKDRSTNVRQEATGIAGGTAAGTILGSSIGVAALGSAFPGTLPLAFLLGLLGWGGAKILRQRRELKELREAYAASKALVPPEINDLERS